jgi:hypothetical protein
MNDQPMTALEIKAATLTMQANRQTVPKLDAFTLAYIEAALWSSTGPKFGKCPCCGKDNVLLDKWPEEHFERQEMCSGPECGTRETAHEPPLDENYSRDDMSPECLAVMVADCAKFQKEQAANLVDYPTVRAGHDFWLTRNGHGSGFWENDFGTEEQCEALDKACKSFGEFNLYPGDDGRIYGQ